MSKKIFNKIYNREAVNPKDPVYKQIQDQIRFDVENHKNHLIEIGALNSLKQI